MFNNQAVTGPEPQDSFQAVNCMINFTVDRNGIIDDVTVNRYKCIIKAHGQKHPPASRT